MNHNFQKGDKVSFELNDLFGSISTGEIVKICKDNVSIKIKKDNEKNPKEILTRPHWECKVIDS